MKGKTVKIQLFLWILILCLPLEIAAVGKNYSVRLRQKVGYGWHGHHYEERTYTYYFSFEVIADGEGQKAEYYQGGNPFLRATPGQRYSIRIHNPLPVRCAVNLMVDGLNSITGAPGSPSGGSKWLLEPNSSITIQGWQVNEGSLRRFYFTTKQDSYAAWQQERLGQDLTSKCGIISAAFFWNRRELERYYERYVLYRREQDDRVYESKKDYDKNVSSAPQSRYEEEKAGTGMGEKNSHPVESVDFQYDMGMYGEDDMVKIYYNFGYPNPIYRPYRYSESSKDTQFAPEKN